MVVAVDASTHRGNLEPFKQTDALSQSFLEIQDFAGFFPYALWQSLPLLAKRLKCAGDKIERGFH